MDAELRIANNFQQFQSLLSLCEQLKNAKTRVFVLTQQLKRSGSYNEAQMRELYMELGKAHMEVDRLTELLVAHT